MKKSTLGVHRRDSIGDGGAQGVFNKASSGMCNDAVHSLEGRGRLEKRHTGQYVGALGNKGQATLARIWCLFGCTHCQSRKDRLRAY